MLILLTGLVMAWLLTVLIEGAAGTVLVVAGNLIRKRPVCFQLPRFLYLNLIMNTATNLTLNLLLSIFAMLSDDFSFVIMGVLEVAVFVIEALCLRVCMNWSRKKAALTSIVLNGLSLGLGLVLLMLESEGLLGLSLFS